MKQCSDARKAYESAQWDVHSGRQRRRHLFEQLLGEHALLKAQLVRAASAKRTMDILNTWAQLDRVNREWASLIAGDDAPLEFRRTSSRLVHGYSQLLGAWIVDPATRAPTEQDIEHVADVESRFYAALGDNVKVSGSEYGKRAAALRRQWEQYTRAVVALVHSAIHKDPDEYYWAAAECMIAGRALGRSLDAVFQ